MKKVFMLSILVLMGCENKLLEKPSLNKNQLVPIIADLRILESAYALRYQQVDTSVVNIQSYQQEIFQRYQKSAEDVISSIQYYSARPDSMKSLDSLVLIELEIRSRSVNQLVTEPEKIINQNQGTIH
jgi:hypothetical protein